SDMGCWFVKWQGEAAATTVAAAAASFGPIEFDAASCRRWVSLICAGWLPQDGTFGMSGSLV
ncbi:hypothetical protein QRB36_26105, partial [Mycobacterium marseillense]|uniref:hypothetical protein n=1 Tax=Mycobacterium marseillense TaxID=701042 RepID=UPI0025956BB8